MNDAQRDALLARLDERTLRVDHALFGNGGGPQTGLVSLVANHQARLNAFDTIYATSLSKEGPLMQEWGAFKDKVNKLESNVPSPKVQRATGIAAFSALLTALVPIFAAIFGVHLPMPPAK